MEERLKRIMSRIFEIPFEEITEDTSVDTVEKWDSLNHMNLILALEEAFNIAFSADEIADMLNYELVVMRLKEHGAAI